MINNPRESNAMAKKPDWATLERQAVEQLPRLKAQLASPMTARKRLGLLLRVAVIEDMMKARAAGEIG